MSNTFYPKTQGCPSWLEIALKVVFWLLMPLGGKHDAVRLRPEIRESAADYSPRQDRIGRDGKTLVGVLVRALEIEVAHGGLD
jgi:hypothetical protein